MTGAASESHDLRDMQHGVPGKASKNLIARTRRRLGGRTGAAGGGARMTSGHCAISGPGVVRLCEA